MLSYDRVKELLVYDQFTGVITWRIHRRGTARAGDVAGRLRPSGYRTLCIDDREYLAHRVIWLYWYGVLPTYHIDHINGNRSDNRLCNLRDVPRHINSQNQHRPQKGNKSGYLGVNPHNGKWRAVICVRRKNIELGYFSTPQEAHAAYIAAKKILHPESGA